MAPYHTPPLKSATDCSQKWNVSYRNTEMTILFCAVYFLVTTGILRGCILSISWSPIDQVLLLYIAATLQI